MTPWVAASRSASGKTMLGDLPPSSNVSGFSASAEALVMARPVSVEPVRLTLPTPRWRTRASPTSSPRPLTMLSTPGGKTSASSSPSRSTDALACSAGLTITVFPAASAYAALAEKVEMGEFHGMMQTATPYGSRRVSPSASGPSTTVSPLTASRHCPAASCHRYAIPGRSRFSVSRRILPLSRVSSSASSWACRPNSSDTLRRTCALAAAGSADQAGKARVAAATAASASAAPLAGIRAHGSPVAGLTVSIWRAAGTSSPPIRLR